MREVAHELSGAARRVTRVMIVDDHPTFAELLALALDGEDDFRCVGTAADLSTGVELASRTRPDLVVMDIQLAAESGLDAARRIRSVLPDVVVVVVSAHRDPNWVVRASQAGANAFAPKSGSLAELLSTLRGAGRGAMPVTPSLFGRRAASSPFSAEWPEKLTRREQQVLVLMGQGLAPGPIAGVLDISVNTCRGYVKTILVKLGASSQLEAVVKAQRLGLIAVAVAG